MQPDKAAKYTAPALEKGLDILELLAGNQGGMTQSTIAKELGKSQSEIYRMLSTLVRRGYVLRVSSGDLYTLSLKLFSTAQRHSPLERLLEAAVPMMRRATRTVWQSCHLGMENNGSIVVVSSVEAPGNWGLAIRTGSVIGLWNTGTGRVLAAYRNSEDLNELMETHLPAAGEPPLDKPKFLEEIAQLREKGYYKAPSETLVGVTNLSFPVFDPLGEIVATISCPFLERVDALETANLEKTELVFSKLATDLTDYFKGEVVIPEETL